MTTVWDPFLIFVNDFTQKGLSLQFAPEVEIRFNMIMLVAESFYVVKPSLLVFFLILWKLFCVTSNCCESSFCLDVEQLLQIFSVALSSSSTVVFVIRAQITTFILLKPKCTHIVQRNTFLEERTNGFSHLYNGFFPVRIRKEYSVGYAPFLLSLLTPLN